MQRPLPEQEGNRMSVKPVTYYKVVCDWSGCDADAHEDTDYSAWGEPQAALDQIPDDWWTSRDGERHYCNDHPCQWASDLNDGYDQEPERPYLLIHDQDTGDSEDDGKVTLMSPDAASAGEPKENQ